MAEKPNLYIGLICAAGTDLSDIKQQLQAQLAVVGYKYHELKVSSAIADALEIIPSADEYDRMIELMAAGDQLREHSEEGSGVASLIVTAIRAARPDGEDQDTSTAYVIDSLKNPKEVEVLDQLYGRNFYSISVYSAQDDRALYLANKIARSRKQALDKCHFDLAHDLITKDQKGESDTGQSVRDTFPKADFFVDGSRDQSAVSRFIRLIFQDPFVTPTLDEYMMFVAKATALRSCDCQDKLGQWLPICMVRLSPPDVMRCPFQVGASSSKAEMAQLVTIVIKKSSTIQILTRLSSRFQSSLGF